MVDDSTQISLHNAWQHRLTSDLERLEQELVRLFFPKAAQEQYHTGKVAHEHLLSMAKEIKALSREYVAEKESRDVSSVRSAERAQAYACYFGIVNFWRVGALLGKVCAHGLAHPQSVLDFGSGTGAASLAAKSIYPSIASVDLVDTSSPMKAIAAELFSKLWPEVSLRNNNQQYDIILAANVLNELPFSKRIVLCSELFSQLADNGVLVLVEPALFDTTRDLMQLRDALCSQTKDLQILFPCTHMLPCPMLAAYPTDWCHGELAWHRTKLIQQLDLLAGFNKHSLKYSALVLQKARPKATVLARRVVSLPLYKKGYWHMNTCGAGTISETPQNGKKRERYELHSLVPISRPDGKTPTSD